MNKCDEGVNDVENGSTVGKKIKILEDCPRKPAGYVSVDGISGLPDDVLAIILSHLSFKQATQTSVLSTRWRYSWTLFTGTLDFDASDRLAVVNLLRLRPPLDLERKRFVNWVNQVLEVLQARSIDGLRICFDVDSKPDIDRWMSFAVKRRVRKLELNLSRFHHSPQRRKSYNPTLHLLNYLGSSCVTALHLCHVNVTAENLEHILSENPFLESLSVKFSPSLISLKISSPSMKLKHLELLWCYGLTDLQLSSTNLLSLKYVGPVIPNLFVNVPCLTEASLGALYCYFKMNDLFEFSSLLTQLQKLKLDILSPYVSFYNIFSFPYLHSSLWLLVFLLSY
uniref:Uncharacterized protein n=1 Tax=Rhizophora mucronata TaxID=61149 RepID=A0A2P2LT25_RHIMU